MAAGKHMKFVALIILVLSLLQPPACFAHPCESCLGNPDCADTSGTFGSDANSQDADDCDSTFCCAVYMHPDTGIAVAYTPLVSTLVAPERHHTLPKVVIPIFIPPQNLA
jgi:hypothetical protein